MTEPLFDLRLRAMRRDRALRQGPALFVYERLFDDCLERIEGFGRRFARAAYIGCPNAAWSQRLRASADQVDAVDDVGDLAPHHYDLCLAIGTLDTVNDLPATLHRLRHSLMPGSLFIGAIPGGDTLPQLRSAMRAADGVTGTATPHVHPRIEASALAPLLQSAGFVTPVVDVDRLRVSYASLQSLVNDLRGMAATNILNARSRCPVTKRGAAAAAAEFARLGDGRRTEEIFEILHFAAWTPQTELPRR